MHKNRQKRSSHELAHCQDGKPGLKQDYQRYPKIYLHYMTFMLTMVWPPPCPRNCCWTSDQALAGCPQEFHSTACRPSWSSKMWFRKQEKSKIVEAKLIFMWFLTHYLNVHYIYIQMRWFMVICSVINKTKIQPANCFLTIPSHSAGVSLLGFLFFATLLTGDGDVGSGFGTFALGLRDNENASWYFLHIYIYIYIYSFLCLFIHVWIHLSLIYTCRESQHAILSRFLSLASGITLIKCEISQMKIH